MKGVLLVVAGALAALAADAAPNTKARERLAGKATSYCDVVYLPDRVSGVPGHDNFLTLNVHVPATGAGPFPCVLLDHGGGGNAGDKEDGAYYEYLGQLLGRGYVVANMNYILGEGSELQRLYDHRAAVRFLRVNAAKYRLDPDRILAWGYSAGAWYTSLFAFSTADDLHGSRGPVSLIPLAQGKTTKDLAIHFGRRSGPPWVVTPLDDPTPDYGAMSSRVTAELGDLLKGEAIITPDDPPFATYVGEAGVSKFTEPAKVAGVPFFPILHLNPRHKGWANLHGFVAEEPSRLPTGKDGTVLEAIFAWIDFVMKESPQCPAPEFRPNQRWFHGSVEVQPVTSSNKVKVHYTLDGSQPTTASPVMTQPVKFTQTTIIKAIAARDGMKPSGVTQAAFIAGPPVPQVTGPSGTVLRGKTGVPLNIQFTSDIAGMQWRMEAHFLKPPRDRSSFEEFTGITLDLATGKLTGTPKQAGVHTLLVLAARGPMEPAGSRTYTLVIEGTGKAVAPVTEGEDPYRDLARAATLSETAQEEFVAACTVAGLRVIAQPAGDGCLFVAHHTDLVAARKAVADWNRKHPQQHITLIPEPK